MAEHASGETSGDALEQNTVGVMSNLGSPHLQTYATVSTKTSK